MGLIKSKHIVVSEENYEELRNLGNFGDSFNDVLTQVLKNHCAGKTNNSQPAQEILSQEDSNVI